MTPEITTRDILYAAKRIAPHVIRTPLLISHPISAIVGRETYLKLEIMQPTGSFKLRGATNAVIGLLESTMPERVVCCSTGNHGRAVAYIAERVGVKAMVCLPSTVSEYKRRQIEMFGAQINLTGSCQDDAQDEVRRLTTTSETVEIPPFDDRLIISGQGTIGLEVMSECPGTQSIIVPLSGGGLVSGIALAAKSIDPSTRIIAATLSKGAAMAESLRIGRPTKVDEAPTVAEALSGGIGEDNQLTFELCRTLVDDVVQVSEEEIVLAMRLLFDSEHLMVEGAGAIGVAALLSGRVFVEGKTSIIITGNNIASEKFMNVIKKL